MFNLLALQVDKYPSNVNDSTSVGNLSLCSSILDQLGRVSTINILPIVSLWNVHTSNRTELTQYNP